jgi:hypothetical protein
MNEYAPLLTAVVKLLNYIQDRDVADEITYDGKGIHAWKSDEFKRCIRETREALNAVTHKPK